MEDATFLIQEQTRASIPEKSLDAAVLIDSFNILVKEFLFIFPPNTHDPLLKTI